jgi:spore coat protein CotH
VGSAPWGTVFDDVKPYSSKDKYEDEHPFFNLSVLATIRVEIDEKDYVQLLLPENLYNETYVSANVYFDNGNIQSRYENAGFRIKGAYSRLDQKKGWVVKANAFNKDQTFLPDDKTLTKIGMKSGSVNDDTLLKTKLYGDFVRAVGVPTQRSSYALLYINDIYVGIYYMHEEIDGDFIKARIENDSGKGNFMKYFWNVHLGYYGSDVTYYQNKAHVNELGVPMFFYEQSDGNGDWTDFIDWLYYFNTTHNDTFEKTIPNYININGKKSKKFLVV